MEKFKAWLWPDRTIGKKESRRLREEYNQLYNKCHEKHFALILFVKQYEGNGHDEREFRPEMIAARKALS